MSLQGFHIESVCGFTREGGGCSLTTFGLVGFS
jgi:hypothetical protein